MSLEIRVLGPLEILVDEAPIRVDTRKALAIVALLAVEGRPYARDELAAMFWPESDDESARHALFRNGWLWLAVTGSLALQAAVIYGPALQRAFGTVALGATDWLLCAAVASTVVLAREGVKAWWRHVDRKIATLPRPEPLRS